MWYYGYRNRSTRQPDRHEPRCVIPTPMSARSSTKRRPSRSSAPPPITARPSYFVLRYLASHGYRVFPINPGLAGQTIVGLPVYARLVDVPEPIDMIDIFRNSEAKPAAWSTRRSCSIPMPKVIWMQLTVRKRCGGRARRGSRIAGRHESLSEDRIRPPLGRDRLGRHQLARHLVESAAHGSRRSEAHARSVSSSAAWRAEPAPLSAHPRGSGDPAHKAAETDNLDTAPHRALRAESGLPFVRDSLRWIPAITGMSGSGGSDMALPTPRG